MSSGSLSRCILPDGPFGSSSRKWMTLGVLKRPTRASQKLRNTQRHDSNDVGDKLNVALIGGATRRRVQRCDEEWRDDQDEPSDGRGAAAHRG